MDAKNLQHDSHSPNCGCGTWIHHWENYSTKKAGLCSALNCPNTATIGGHVQKKGVGDNNWYIIPICSSHNNRFGQGYDVKSDTVFAPVGKTSSCGQ
jgi:hypothetical protein